jgi:hypothetical protein
MFLRNSKKFRSRYQKKKKKKNRIIKKQVKNVIHKTSSSFIWNPTILQYFCCTIKMYNYIRSIVAEQ